ncbi:MAG: nucleoside-diphosphate kinase [Candidatus Sumerlaeia bacterium]|nr:nucleoside-diphosphate kinase [Candidatus Sumerlaeia bacterium]
METTLILIKPDAVSRKLIGEIVSRFESKGLTIRAMKLIRMSSELADKHYAEHVSKPFYPELKAFMTGSPLVALAVAGPDAISLCRKMMGATKPADAAPGTIRGDYATVVTENLVHGSDSADSAKRELALWFTEAEYAC